MTDEELQAALECLERRSEELLKLADASIQEAKLMSLAGKALVAVGLSRRLAAAATGN